MFVQYVCICSLYFCLITGSGWQQELPTVSSRSYGRYPERQFGNEAAIEHGKRLRHQSKNPGYFKQIGKSTHKFLGAFSFAFFVGKAIYEFGLLAL